MFRRGNTATFAKCCWNRVRIKKWRQRGRRLRRGRGEGRGRENKGLMDFHGRKRNDMQHNIFWIQCVFVVA